MPTRQQLEDALRAADAAGNTDDAKALAQALQSMPQDAGPQTPSATSGGLYNVPYLGPAASELQHLTSVAGGALTRGVAGTLALPGEVASLAKDYGPSWLQGPANALAAISPRTKEDINPVIHYLGMEGEAPQGKGENFLAGAMEGMGAGGPIGALGGLGATLGHELMPDSAWAPVAGSLLGGFGGSGALSLFGRKMLQKSLSLATGSSNEALSVKNTAQETLDEIKAEGEQLGQQQRELSAAHEAARSSAQEAHQATVAAAKQQAADTIEQATQGANSTIEATADALHPAKTLQEAGTVVQQSATHWLGGLDDKVGALLNPLYDRLPKGATTDLSNFKKALADINSDAGQLEALNQDLKPRLPKIWQDRLTNLEGLESVTGTQFAPSIQDLKTLRTSLGHALADPKVINDVGAQNANYLYAALSADLRQPFEAAGLGEAWDSANAQAKSLYDFARDTVGQVIKSEGGKGNLDPEKIASALLSAGNKGGSTLSALRSEMPDAADALAASAARNGQWAKMSPEAKAALVPNVAQRTALDGAYASRDAAKATANEAMGQQIDASRQSLDDLISGQKQEQRDLAGEIIANKRNQLQAKGVLAAASSSSKDKTQAVQALTEKLGKMGKKSDPLHALTTISGSILGGEMGSNLGNLIGGHFLGLSPQAMELIGAGAPLAMHVASNVWNNPRSLFPPLLALSAGHALAVQPPPSGEQGSPTR